MVISTSQSNQTEASKATSSAASLALGFAHVAGQLIGNVMSELDYQRVF
jgi:hypothetical protein